MAKKQPRKAVKIEDLEPSTTVASVVDSVRDEVSDHSARVGYELTLKEALRAITSTQSTSVLFILRTLLFGVFGLDTKGNVTTDGGIRELVNDPEASEEDKIDTIGSVVVDLYSHWTQSLKNSAIANGVKASKYTNIAESLRTPINVLSMTFIWGDDKQIARVLKLASPSNDKGNDTTLADARRLANELLIEYAVDGRVTNGTYQDKNKKDQPWSISGLVQDRDDIKIAEDILRDTLEANDLGSRERACLSDARSQVKLMLSKLIPDGRGTEKTDVRFKQSATVQNELGSSDMDNARKAINTTLQVVATS